MELPCTYRYRTTDGELHGKLVKLIEDYMEGYQERIKEIEARTLKKQKKNTQKKYSSKVYGTLCNIYCTTLTQIKIFTSNLARPI